MRMSFSCCMMLTSRKIHSIFIGIMKDLRCKTKVRLSVRQIFVSKNTTFLSWLMFLAYLTKESVNKEQSVTVLKDYASFSSGWHTLVATATSEAFSADLSMKSP